MSEEKNKEQRPGDGKTGSPEEKLSENILPPESIEQSQPETQNSKLQTENMEVHHPPHVEKKKFKEYMKQLFIFLFILSFHPAFSQNMHSNDIATIKSNRATSNNAIAKHDVDGIAKFWLDDFVQVIGRGTYDTGKENIAASWKALFDSNPQISYVRNPEEIIISDNDTLAWETGVWIGIHSYSKGGNYSAMWIKRNGNWMIKAELFVSLKANK